MEFTRTTEQESNHKNLQDMSTEQLLTSINQEDQTVAGVVAGCIPQVTALVDTALTRMKRGGRLIYMGAGTSGRLGVVDASECPPTFGVASDRVIGLIAGGDTAIRSAVEFAEDSTNQGWQDLQDLEVNENDFVIGIAASGTTPYVLGALRECNDRHVATGCITCNEDSPLHHLAQYPVVAVVGPEFVTGSSRMKAGTAQKLILNMISTSLMIQLGHVQGNRMVDMQLSNHKLVDRGTRMVMEQTQLNEEDARKALLELGSVRAAVKANL